jgi:hypothetical protein
LTNENTDEEVWREVPGYPGYEVSTHGRLRSYWRRGSKRPASKPRLRQAGTVGPCGFKTFYTPADSEGKRENIRVGTMVALAFIGPRPEGAEVRRLDGNTLNDRLDNIAYGTPEEVAADHAARARREEAAGAPTHCPEGHRYSDSWLGNWGERLCDECKKDTHSQWWAEKGEQRNALLRQQTKLVADARGPRITKCVDCQVEVVSKFVTGSLPKRCEPCRKAKRTDKNPPPWVTCPDCGTRWPREPGKWSSQRCQECTLIAGRARYRRRREQLRELLGEAAR